MNNQCGTVFVTVGSTRFENLVREFLKQSTFDVLKRAGIVKVVLQHGQTSSHLVENLKSGISTTIQIECFPFANSISKYLENSEYVVSHAGTGSIIETLRKGKRLLVVCNNQLMNNHQMGLSKKLHNLGFLLETDLDGLNKGLHNLLQQDGVNLKVFPEQEPNVFGSIIERRLNLKW